MFKLQKKYSLPTLRQDIMAALTVTVLGLPQSMAYAIMAGVEPIYGLYSSTIPVIVCSLLGSSRFLIGGPTNTVSMLIYTALIQIHVNGILLLSLPPEVRVQYVFAISLISGCIQLLLGLTKLGRFASFLSYPVVIAYTVGCALLIGIGQIETFLGLSLEVSTSVFDLFRGIIIYREDIHLFSVLVGAGTIVLSLLFQKIHKNLPSYFMAIVVATFVGYLADLRALGVPMADFVTTYFPPITNPLPIAFADFDLLFMPALAVAIISSVDSIANGRIFANRRNDAFNVNQELCAQGISKMVGGFTSSIPGSGSFSRTALNYMAGAESRFSGVFSALFTLLAIGVFGSCIGYIPIPALAGMLILTSISMIKKKDILFVWNTSRQDKIVFLVTLSAVLFLSLDIALIVGVLLSLAIFLNNETHLRIGKIPRHRLRSHSSAWVLQSSEAAFYTMEGAFFFGATESFENTFIKNTPQDPKVFIIHMTRMHFLDSSGARSIELFMRKLKERNAWLILSGANPEVLKIIHNSGLSAGKWGCYITGNIDGAIELSQYLLKCIDECEYPELEC